MTLAAVCSVYRQVVEWQKKRERAVCPGNPKKVADTLGHCTWYPDQCLQTRHAESKMVRLFIGHCLLVVSDLGDTSSVPSVSSVDRRCAVQCI